MHFRFDRHFLPTIAVAAVAGCATAPAPSGSTGTASGTSAAITVADLRSRVYIYADDSMMGRKAGTEGNNKATLYIANELRRMGVQPGGENGTYFQNVPLLHLQASRTKPIVVDGRNFLPAKDYIGRTPKTFGNVQAIYGGVFGEASMITPEAAAGKVVVLAVPKDAAGKPRWSGTRQPSSSRYRTAHSVAIVGMDGMAPSDWIPLMEEGQDFLNDPSDPPNLSINNDAYVGFLYVTNAMAEAMMGGSLASMAPGTAGRMIGGGMGFDTTRVVARNVIGIIPGSDRALKGQYVAVGAHNDHVGMTSAHADHDSLKAYNMIALPQGADSTPREMTPTRVAEMQRLIDSLRRVSGRSKRDSVYNGADDDASGSMSVLEIAEAFQKAAVKPKRSIIFVWHTGEELGLFGSQYFTDHPTVPRDSIVAQLNMDMVGRGGAGNLVGRTIDGKDIWGSPDYVQLVGSRRLSTQLGDLIEDVNSKLARPMKIDYSIDANAHPGNIYCRSDHYMYARYGIPIVFFFTGLHEDYHQVTDEPQYIAYPHYTSITQYVKDLAVRVSNLDQRPVVDQAVPAPGTPCRQ